MSDARGECRLCGRVLSRVFVDLGVSPLSNAYLARADLQRMEPFYPLRAFICDGCLLVQLPEVQEASAIFADDYAYFSSYSASYLRHCEAYAAMAVERFGLDGSSLVMELASNDGYLLQYFQQRGIPVLGVEPSGGVAEAAIEKGIPTIVRFFGVAAAHDLLRHNKQPDLMVGNNVLAHVPDLSDFIKGIAVMLGPRGVLTMEFPHIMRLLDDCLFDTIYHEHYSYFSFLTARRAFEQHGLTVFDVDEVDTHGGSLRIYVRHSEDPSKPASDNVRALEQRERSAGVHELAPYLAFSGRVNAIKRALLLFLLQAGEQGKKVVGYGAPAKASTLFNYCGIREDLVEFTVDRSPHKQGRYLPGCRIPILAPEALEQARPDYVLILPWNLKNEIVAQLAHLRGRGTRFVVPLPKVEILD